MHKTLGVIFAAIAIALAAYAIWYGTSGSLKQSDLVSLTGFPTDVDEFSITRRGHTVDCLVFSVQDKRFETGSDSVDYKPVRSAVLANKELELGILPNEVSVSRTSYHFVRIDGTEVVTFAQLQADSSEQRTAVVVVTAVLAGVFSVMAGFRFYEVLKD